jgi:hypothetical protein
MGGYGSGGWHYGPKTQVEQCIILSSSWLLQNHYFDLGVGHRAHLSLRWLNYFKEPIYTLTGELDRVSPHLMRLYLCSTGQVVYLQSTGCRFGGVRWWFACPRCERRCAKLYLRSNAGLLCRVCQDLTYRSCIEGKSELAFLASLAAENGWSIVAVKRALSEDKRSRTKWRRKRDRRPSYKGRGWRLREG